MFDRDRPSNTERKDIDMNDLLDAQRKHAEKNKGRTSDEGGEDYKATEAERLAGDVRLVYYETAIAEASNQGDQASIDSLMEEYHAKRLETAQARIDARDEN